MTGGGLKSTSIFVPSLRAGGAERIALTLCSALADQSHPITLVLAMAKGRLLAQVPEGIRIVDLKSRSVLSSLPGLTLYLKQNRPSVMLSIMDHAGVVSLWARRISGVKTKMVVSTRGTLSHAAQNPEWIGDRLMPQLIRHFYPWADAIVAVSKGVADDLSMTARLTRNRIRVIYNPVLTPSVDEMSRELTGHPWFDGSDIPVLLSAGRLTRVKDLPTLLKAFALLRSRRRVHLAILGEGEERVRLGNMITELGLSDDAALLGFRQNPYAFIARSALVVLSSLTEGLPSVLVEAMACGVPVVSTDCPNGPAEILENGRYGTLVPVGDCRALADAMLRELERPHDAAILRRRAEDFSLARTIQEYKEVLYD